MIFHYQKHTVLNYLRKFGSKKKIAWLSKMQDFLQFSFDFVCSTRKVSQAVARVCKTGSISLSKCFARKLKILPRLFEKILCFQQSSKFFALFIQLHFRLPRKILISKRPSPPSSLDRYLLFFAIFKRQIFLLNWTSFAHSHPPQIRNIPSSLIASRALPLLL